MSNTKLNLNSTSQMKLAIHDLNNIFTSTLASSEILEKLCQSNDKISRYVQTIKANSLRAIDIINDLVDSNNKIKTDIVIADIITNLKLTIKPTLPKNIKLQFKLYKNLNKVEANYSDLYRVFLNLIINAIESITTSGSIVFSAKNDTSKSQIIISIKDTGKGISRQKLKNIFDEGFSLKKHKSNSGLGLAIVKNIIEDYYGSIEVKSKLKVGTEFKITLPAIKDFEAEKTHNKIYKILIADDDKIILELFSELLSSYNYLVTTANDGKKALEKFKKNEFDIVIVDKMMPFMDGIECIKNIRIINPNIPIILTTGFQESIDKKYNDLNITKKIKKPWVFEDMLKIIQELII